MGAMYTFCLTFLLYLVSLMLRVFCYLFFLCFFNCVSFLQHQEAFLLSFPGVTIIFRFALMFLLDLHKIMTLYYFIRQLQYIDSSMTLLTLLIWCPHTAQIRKHGFKGSRPVHSKFSGGEILVSFTASTFRHLS